MGTGQTLGRYQIIKHLASGGMAQVLLAKATGIEGFERYVVIKRIHVERAHDPTIVKMFTDEARLAASLHHPNIVQVHDIGQENGEYFFAMEYVHGEDLRTILTKLNDKGAYMPLEHVVTVVSAAASALHYAHEHRGPNRQPLNIVHRDVSPANIIVGYAGQVKVVDFGIAKATASATETQSGTLKGKISYMAPEQCMNLPVDRRSDVFALGIVLWELTTVRRLFRGSSDFLTMTAIAHGDVPLPSQHRPDIPRELEAIIMKALARNPAQRYQTAEELRIALDEFATRAGLRSSLTAVASYLEQEFGRRPEPWLSETGAWIVPPVDFDGRGADPSGEVIAPPPYTGSTGSGTPMAWTPMPTATKASRSGGRRIGVVFAIALPLVIGGVVAISQLSGSEPASPSVTTQPANAPEPEAPAPEVKPLDPVAQPAPIEAPAGSAAGSAIETADETGSGSTSGSATNVAATKPKPVQKKPARKSDPATSPEWNPDKLFLKKKPK